jgi:hypothetical protein
MLAQRTSTATPAGCVLSTTKFLPSWSKSSLFDSAEHFESKVCGRHRSHLPTRTRACCRRCGLAAPTAHDYHIILVTVSLGIQFPRILRILEKEGSAAAVTSAPATRPTRPCVHLSRVVLWRLLFTARDHRISFCVTRSRHCIHLVTPPPPSPPTCDRTSVCTH